MLHALMEMLLTVSLEPAWPKPGFGHIACDLMLLCSDCSNISVGETSHVVIACDSLWLSPCHHRLPRMHVQRCLQSPSRTAEPVEPLDCDWAGLASSGTSLIPGCLTLCTCIRHGNVCSSCLVHLTLQCMHQASASTCIKYLCRVHRGQASFGAHGGHFTGASSGTSGFIICVLGMYACWPAATKTGGHAPTMHAHCNCSRTATASCCFVQ